VSQLCVALVLFALWTAFRLGKPQQAKVWQDRLDGMMSQTCDLFGACRQLGESISQGEDVVVSVGNWCQTVFLPKDSPGGHA
jgi:hypothetical protein